MTLSISHNQLSITRLSLECCDAECHYTMCHSTECHGALLLRWANKLDAENRAGEEKPFNHPFLQSGFMFVGEVLCLFAFFITVHYSVKSWIK